MKKAVVVQMNKSHRIGVLVVSSLLTVGVLASMIAMASMAEMELWLKTLLCIAPIIPLLILPLYYASWQIVLNINGIQKKLFWINMGSHSWAQVKEVRSTFSYTEQEIISIHFKDGKTVRFRMTCENADKARKLILTHCSIGSK